MDVIANTNSGSICFSCKYITCPFHDHYQDALAGCIACSGNRYRDRSSTLFTLGLLLLVSEEGNDPLWPSQYTWPQLQRLCCLFMQSALRGSYGCPSAAWLRTVLSTSFICCPIMAAHVDGLFPPGLVAVLLDCVAWHSSSRLWYCVSQGLWPHLRELFRPRPPALETPRSTTPRPPSQHRARHTPTEHCRTPLIIVGYSLIAQMWEWATPHIHQVQQKGAAPSHMLSMNYIATKMQLLARSHVVHASVM